MFNYNRELFVEKSSFAIPQKLSNNKILMVDDDTELHDLTRVVLSDFINKNNIEMMHAYSGKEAMEVLRQDKDIQLVILDIQMKTSDAGLQVARYIRKTLEKLCVKIMIRSGQLSICDNSELLRDVAIGGLYQKQELDSKKLLKFVEESFFKTKDNLEAF